jgi:DNA invertase Pin-like site-specific DNA recombinase
MSPIPAVFYARLSSGKQEASIPEQKEWARRAAKRHDVEILRSFEDPGIPGSEIEHRPGLMEMVKFCEKPPGRAPQAIMVWDPDRLSRANSIRAAALLDRLMGAGVSRMLTQEGWLDFEDDVDRLLFNLRQDVGREAYSKSISKNVTRSNLARAKEGLWVAGRPPYAYAVGDHGHLVLGDPRHVGAILWLFREYTTTAASLGDMARRLNEIGAPPPWRIGTWTRSTGRMMLCNQVYLGRVVWYANRRAKYFTVAAGEICGVRGQRRNTTKIASDPGDRIVVEGAHPALVDQETFDRAAAKMAESRWKRTTPLPGGGEWVLSGLIYCARCGDRMIGHTQRRRDRGYSYTYRRYVCQGNHKRGAGTCTGAGAHQHAVLREVARLIREGLTPPDKLAAIKSRVEAIARKKGIVDRGERKLMAERVAELDRQIEEGLPAY